MNLGSRYQPKNYRRPSRKRRRRRPSKKPKKRRPTKKQTKRRPPKKRGASKPRRKEEKRRLKVSDIMFEIHRSLMSKPDQIIPTVKNRELFQGLFKLFYIKSLFFLLSNLNLGSRYDPSDYRRLSYQPRHYRSLRYQPRIYRGLLGNNLGKN